MANQSPSALDLKYKSRARDGAILYEKLMTAHTEHIPILQFRPLIRQLHPIQQCILLRHPPTVDRVCWSWVHTPAHAHAASVLKPRADTLRAFRPPLPVLHLPSSINTHKLALKQIHPLILQCNQVISLLCTSPQRDNCPSWRKQTLQVHHFSLYFYVCLHRCHPYSLFYTHFQRTAHRPRFLAEESFPCRQISKPRGGVFVPS